MEDIFEELNDRDIEEIVEEDEPTERANAPDEAEEEPTRTVKPKVVVHRPQPKLDPIRLTGPRGIGTLQSFFKDVKFKGKGHEEKDLNVLMMNLEHWCHRLFPKMKFDDCLERMEELGSKRPVQTYITKLRLGMEGDGEEVRRGDSPIMDEEDAFDQLIQGTQNPQPSTQQSTLTDEQRARMLRNRLIAEERRMARMKADQERLLANVFQLDTNQGGEQDENGEHPVSVVESGPV